MRKTGTRSCSSVARRGRSDIPRRQVAEINGNARVCVLSAHECSSQGREAASVGVQTGCERKKTRKRERRSRTFTRKRGEPLNCRCVLALTYSQSSSVHKSRPIFHPFSLRVLRPPLYGWCILSLSLLLCPSCSPTRPLNRSLFSLFYLFFFFFFSLVHSLPTQRYEPSHLLHDRKGEEGVESGGERGRKVCKAVYINDVRKPAIDIELIFKLVCVPVTTCSGICCSTVHCQGSLPLTFQPLTE